MPISNLLIGVREREHARFGKSGPGDLQADGQSFAREPARNRNRRKAKNIERLRIAEERGNSARRRRLLVRAVGDCGGSERRGGRYQNVGGRKRAFHYAAQAVQFAAAVGVSGCVYCSPAL